METLIKWKPSQLPVNTVIEAPDPWFDNGGRTRIPWIKYAGGWEEIGADNQSYVRDDEQDEKLADYEILSVPMSWFIEFRKVENDRGRSWVVNREGQLQDTVEVGKRGTSWTRMFRPAVAGEKTILLNGELVPLGDVVRRAFA